MWDMNTMHSSGPYTVIGCCACVVCGGVWRAANNHHPICRIDCLTLPCCCCHCRWWRTFANRYCDDQFALNSLLGLELVHDGLAAHPDYACRRCPEGHYAGGRHTLCTNCTYTLCSDPDQMDFVGSATNVPLTNGATYAGCDR